MMGERDLDDRFRSHFEEHLGFPLATVRRAGVEVRESPKRTDTRDNRLCIVRTGSGALATAIPRVVAAISPVIGTLTIDELFSPLGLAELRRAMAPEDAESLAHGLDYILAERGEFRPAETPHKPVALTKKDIPPGQFEMRMRERRPPAEAEEEDFVWAFACYHDDQDAEAAELALFGPHCASIAIVIWKSADVASFGVWTEETYRGRRYALAATSAATEFILEQGAVAMYGAYTDNVPSLRIPRQLGFMYAWQTIWA